MGLGALRTSKDQNVSSTIRAPTLAFIPMVGQRRAMNKVFQLLCALAFTRTHCKLGVRDPITEETNFSESMLEHIIQSLPCGLVFLSHKCHRCIAKPTSGF